MGPEARDATDPLAGTKALAERLSVDLHVRRSERIFLDYVGNGGVRGSGSRVIAELCATADVLKLPAALNAMGGDDYLIRLYGGFGFEVVDPEDDEGPLMVRQPRDVPAAITAATFLAVQTPPPSGGVFTRSRSIAKISGVRIRGFAPFRRRRSPSEDGPKRL